MAACEVLYVSGQAARYGVVRYRSMHRGRSGARVSGQHVAERRTEPLLVYVRVPKIRYPGEAP
jgi:hypothetical protein